MESFKKLEHVIPDLFLQFLIRFKNNYIEYKFYVPM